MVDEVKSKLNDRQIRFCQNYAIDLNATRAYKEVYAIESDEIAAPSASRLLSNVKVKRYVRQLQEEAASVLKITKDKVIDAYHKLAFYDARKFYDKQGELLPVPKLDEETSFALTGFEITEEKRADGNGIQATVAFTKKIKMSDRRGALDGLSRILGFNAPSKISQTDTAGNDVKQKTDEELIALLAQMKKAIQ